MDMSGTTTNDTAYTGAVCMSITTVANTTNLPLSDPFCNTDACLAFKVAHQASQANASYYRQFDYGHYTIWYSLAVIGVGIIRHLLRKYRNYYPPLATETPSANHLCDKVVALGRAAAYSSVGGSIAARFGMPRFGLLAFLLFSFVFFFLLTFLKHPYYRDRRGYGSPPLGVRAGLMSTTLVPIIVALAGKVNIISFLTGVEYSKLNILHRWASYLCLFLALVHTIPFLAIALDNCGSSGLHAQFYKPGSFEVSERAFSAALMAKEVELIWRGSDSTLFWHAGQEQDSWAYLWATLAISLSSMLVRLFYKWQTFSLRRSWFSGMPAMVRHLPGNMTRVSITVPGDLRWKPGQHCFLRMPHISMLQNHPFTIANLPATTKDSEYAGFHKMDFYIRASRGLTLALVRSSPEKEQQSQSRLLQMHIDGPYGGLVDDVPKLYQSLVCVAGGGGISACLPQIEHAVQQIRNGTAMLSQIRLLWMIRRPDHTQWILEELKHLRFVVGSETLQIDFYITNGNSEQEEDVGQISGGNTVSIPDSKRGVDKQEPSAIDVNIADDVLSLSNIGAVHNCRPYLPELLPTLLSARRTLVIGMSISIHSGRPESMLLITIAI
ncbi:ferric cupric reductase transmembrane component 7 [Trichoderma arundinaceum]|uniref:ferric-chelate reductase (NADPH) n=1 Tax=Trichoderma arundinaceum TaxID=490622 RepID=A0A395NKH2_TRIAR|nr:ferric cupric reductase transmembrane component 7 [Trichoderma arundinaceum]